MFIAILLLALQSGPEKFFTGSPEKAFAGSTLYAQCKAQIRTEEPNASMVTLAYGALCVGYLNGYIDGVRSSTRVKATVCMRPASLDTIARIYVSYMDRHPKLLDEHQLVGVGAALSEAWPCK